MKKILVTGGTVFVSKYTADYMVRHGYEVYVLNRGTRKQVDGVNLLEGNRHDAAHLLEGIHFDTVLDITAYNGKDIYDLVSALYKFDQYIMVSSSAVYPETEIQPFREHTPSGPNIYWGKYGTDKIEAETCLLKMVPDAYIVRPPYLYGSMNNIYREAFVFECALKNRPFYIPKEGEMKLQFYMVEDLCRFFETLMETKPEEHIFNVGNRDTVSIKEWVTMCYACLDKKPEFVHVYKDIEQRNYFPFYNYEYELDVEKQHQILSETMPLDKGLHLSYEWYRRQNDEVKKKPFIQYIDSHQILM